MKKKKISVFFSFWAIFRLILALPSDAPWKNSHTASPWSFGSLVVSSWNSKGLWEGLGKGFYTKLIKNIKIEIKKKSGFGEVLGQFWIRIRILREKLYIVLGSNPFFIDFRKIDFFKIQYFGIFRLSSYISAYFDGTMQRGLKNYPYCLIFIIFGWN